MLALLPGTAVAACSSVSGQDALQRVGALACLASEKDTQRQEDVTTLTCDLNLFGGKPSLRLSGTMHGRNVTLVEPGTRRVVWSVLAPVRNVEPKALAGAYDTASAHNFPSMEKRSDVLAGGMAGSIVLQLVTPTVDAIGPTTRLELRVGEDSP
jgi:hypothetical protein